ncbi:MAG TPA: hypothetical protein VG935_01450 [Patescibacteria group bacterium]|nr:hypothetical protein [Patescibacteria group bacterium]
MPEVGSDGVINLKEGEDFKVVSEKVPPRNYGDKAGTTKLHDQIPTQEQRSVSGRLLRKLLKRPNEEDISHALDRHTRKHQQKLDELDKKFSRLGITGKRDDDEQVEAELTELKRQVGR